MADGALIVQSDRSVLLEVDHPKADAARAAIAPFAELEKSPEYLHTYRLTPLSLWNAAAAGLTPAQVTDALREHSRYPVPPGLLSDLVETMGRYGRCSCGPARTARVVPADPALLEELVRQRAIAPTCGERLGPDRVAVPLAERGRLKQALMNLGYPVEDLAGYVEGGRPFRSSCGRPRRTGEPFGLRDYQHESVAAFAAAGSAAVIVLPCGAGKTVVGLGAMTAVGARTLILTTNTIAVRQWREELLDKTSLPPEAGRRVHGRRARRSARSRSRPTRSSPTAARRPATSRTSTLFPRENWGLIVYDEVHLLPAPVFRVTAEIQARRRLGLTATLVREDGREDDVFRLIGPKRYDVPWKVLEAQGWIADGRLHRGPRAACPTSCAWHYAIADAREQVPRRRREPGQAGGRAAGSCAPPGRPRPGHRPVPRPARTRSRGASSAPLITGKTPSAASASASTPPSASGEVRRAGRLEGRPTSPSTCPTPTSPIQISGTFGSRQEEAQRLGRILRPKADGGRAHFYTLVTPRHPRPGVRRNAASSS